MEVDGVPGKAEDASSEMVSVAIVIFAGVEGTELITLSSGQAPDSGAVVSSLSVRMRAVSGRTTEASSVGVGLTPDMEAEGVPGEAEVSLSEAGSGSIVCFAGVEGAESTTISPELTSDSGDVVFSSSVGTRIASARIEEASAIGSVTTLDREADGVPGEGKDSSPEQGSVFIGSAVFVGLVGVESAELSVFSSVTVSELGTIVASLSLVMRAVSARTDSSCSVGSF